MFSLCLFFPLCSQKMGKKSRVKTQKSGTGATASVSPKETDQEMEYDERVREMETKIEAERPPE